jgi:hypothetical protein
MEFFNDLIEALVQRNRIEFNNIAITIGLRNGGIEVKGEIPVTVIDTKKSKTLANLVLPVEASVEVKEITFPIPTPV